MAVEYLPSPTPTQQPSNREERSSGPADSSRAAADDARADGLAERLARWALTYLAALAASLSLVGGAWALGLFG